MRRHHHRERARTGLLLGGVQPLAHRGALAGARHRRLRQRVAARLDDGDHDQREVRRGRPVRRLLVVHVAHRPREHVAVADGVVGTDLGDNVERRRAVPQHGRQRRREALARRGLGGDGRRRRAHEPALLLGEPVHEPPVVEERERARGEHETVGLPPHRAPRAQRVRVRQVEHGDNLRWRRGDPSARGVDPVMEHGVEALQPVLHLVGRVRLAGPAEEGHERREQGVRVDLRRVLRERGVQERDEARRDQGAGGVHERHPALKRRGGERNFGHNARTPMRRAKAMRLRRVEPASLSAPSPARAGARRAQPAGAIGAGYRSWENGGERPPVTASLTFWSN